MDIPKEYIKMCEKAIGKLLNHWKLTYGDFVTVKESHLRRKTSPRRILILIKKDNPESVVWRCADPEYGWRQYQPIDLIWLPHQDQLQEMVFGGEKNKDWRNNVAAEKTEFFFNWVKCKKYTMQFKSFEQLWLAFVMEMKYHKIWNGEDWVNEKESIS